MSTCSSVDRVTPGVDLSRGRHADGLIRFAEEFVAEASSERLAPCWRDSEESRDVRLIPWPNRIDGVIEVQGQAQKIGIWLVWCREKSVAFQTMCAASGAHARRR